MYSKNAKFQTAPHRTTFLLPIFAKLPLSLRWRGTDNSGLLGCKIEGDLSL